MKQKSTKTKATNARNLGAYRARQAEMGRKHWGVYVTDNERATLLRVLAEIREQSEIDEISDQSVDVNESSTPT